MGHRVKSIYLRDALTAACWRKHARLKLWACKFCSASVPDCSPRRCMWMWAGHNTSWPVWVSIKHDPRVCDSICVETIRGLLKVELPFKGLSPTQRKRMQSRREKDRWPPQHYTAGKCYSSKLISGLFDSYLMSCAHLGNAAPVSTCKRIATGDIEKLQNKLNKMSRRTLLKASHGSCNLFSRQHSERTQNILFNATAPYSGTSWRSCLP